MERHAQSYIKTNYKCVLIEHGVEVWIAEDKCENQMEQKRESRMEKHTY